MSKENVDLNELEFSAERIESLVEGITVFGRIGDADKLARQALRAIDYAAELRTLRAQVDERVEEGARSLYEMHRREAVGALESELRTLRARVESYAMDLAALEGTNAANEGALRIQLARLQEERSRAESAEARVKELEAWVRDLESDARADAEMLHKRDERITDLESQLAAAREEQGSKTEEAAMLWSALDAEVEKENGDVST